MPRFAAAADFLKEHRNDSYLNETHDPARRSFVESASTADCDFPIQNLPFGIFRPRPGVQPRGGIAIGDQILDVAAAAASFDGAAADAAKACATPHLNRLMALGPQASSALRLAVSRALSVEHGEPGKLAAHLVPMVQAELLLPVSIGDFTDFYASVFHATNAGRAFRPDNPLLPNYKYVPVADHRAAPRRSASAARRSGGRRASESPRIRPRRRMARRATWISNSSLACTSARRPNWAKRFRLAGRRSTFSAFVSLTTGRRATCRRGSTSRSGRSSARTSPPRFPPG